MPHNQVHNYIGGVGPLDPGPYGNMTNFLSPVDPIFFLHHSNMDRLWDVWTRKQKALNLPYLPPQPDLKTLSDEPFLFYVDGKGNYVTDRKGRRLPQHRCVRVRLRAGLRRKSDSQQRRPSGRVDEGASRAKRGTAKGNTASVAVPRAAIEAHLSDLIPRPLMAQVTLPHPGPASSGRSFDVLVGAPGQVTEAAADSPFFAGTDRVLRCDDPP